MKSPSSSQIWRIMVRDGRIVDGGRALDERTLSVSLEAIGHTPAAVAAALERCGAPSSPGGDVIVDRRRSPSGSGSPSRSREAVLRDDLRTRRSTCIWRWPAS